ncbi:ATP synthase F1, gamma subunit [Thamnocephalis sphaerospora]|uniref:ATP synthase subunit gamma n=1 Tax=Thamnocephalis sphaerospora TaxID=78915 RepID=A0A4P9XWY8_9FUNG|nr:ATP synthase F1, gamma subunit [Thamnocephalis sphaerospora]|eukprot:RKP10181.1 ATP synthase F1, gamma subunit [Thamnocephalis sphaerospora]
MLSVCFALYAPRPAATVQARNMATLREIQLRLKSVSNISKITKSMKMIAATKLNRSQRGMEIARKYGQAASSLFEQAETTAPADAKTLMITVSSDRGLCGGIHSSVSKYTKRAAAVAPEMGIVVLGDKAKAQVGRDVGASVQLSFNQLGKAAPTYAEACAVVDVLRESDVTFDHARLVYNRFNSVIAYEATEIPVYSEEVFKNSAKFSQYEIEDDVLDNLYEYQFANTLFWALTEGHAAEMAAKRTAMENATKNANDMIDRLTLTYNRGRQAVITNELIDIITGASAL